LPANEGAKKTRQGQKEREKVRKKSWPINKQRKINEKLKITFRGGRFWLKQERAKGQINS